MKKYLCLLLFFAASATARTLTLEQTIHLAQDGSVDAMMVRNSFLSSYWGFRSHKAELLPSLNFSAEIAQFDRSRRALQDAGSGEIYYRTNYNMRNSGTLSVDQHIALTGGTLSLSSSLNRLDQYSPIRDITFYTQPVTLSYLQPLFTYNRLKWDKQIEPERFEEAKRKYLESMEDVTIKAVMQFFKLAMAKWNSDIAKTNYENTRSMFDIASRRSEQTGSVTRQELLQLELKLLNDSLAITIQDNAYQATIMEFRSFLGYNEGVDIELDVPDDVPEVSLDMDFVMEKVMDNGSFEIAQRVQQLESERSVAQAKANRGISVSANAQFGLTNDDRMLSAAYNNLLNHEVFGLSLRVPIMDWGMGRGRVKMAQAQQEVTLARLTQARADMERSIFLEVLRFNEQKGKLTTFRQAMEIANLRNHLAMMDFKEGKISVTDLNTAQSENDKASMTYLSEMSNFWNYYFTLRKMTLYDFASATDISAEYDKLVK